MSIEVDALMWWAIIVVSSANVPNCSKYSRTNSLGVSGLEDNLVASPFYGIERFPSLVSYTSRNLCVKVIAPAGPGPFFPSVRFAVGSGYGTILVFRGLSQGGRSRLKRPTGSQIWCYRYDVRSTVMSIVVHHYLVTFLRR